MGARPAGATKLLYAVCGLVGFGLVGSFVLTLTRPVDDLLTSVLANLFMTAETVTILLVGGWAYVVSGSSHVDPKDLHRDRVWLFVAWFVPVIHVLHPNQLFGEIWASARIVRQRRSGHPSSPTLSRPWIITAWAWVWAFATGGILLLFF